MSPSATRNRSTRRKKKKAARTWLQVWPLVLGLVATPFAVRAASVLALTGPSAMRTLYPFVVLVQSNPQHFSGDQAATLSQWVMYGQFPVYGLVWILVRRLIGATAGPLSVLLLHGLGVGAAILAANAR